MDEHTRESLAINVAGSIRSTRVIEVLSQLISVRGAPRILRSDNRPEFVSRVLLRWPTACTQWVFSVIGIINHSTLSCHRVVTGRGNLTKGYENPHRFCRRTLRRCVMRVFKERYHRRIVHPRERTGPACIWACAHWTGRRRQE